MSKKENLKKVIAILRDTQEEIHPLLNESPDLQARVNNAMERLANSMAHLGGEQMQIGKAAPGAGRREALTHIGGVKYEPRKSKSVKEAEPTAEELEALEEHIEDILEAIRNDSAREALKGENDFIIRAVAKKVGLNVSATNPAALDYTFIDSIKTALSKKDEAETAAVIAHAKNVETAKDESQLQK